MNRASVTWRERLSKVGNRVLRPLGAELRSLRGTADQLWQGDAEFVAARERVASHTMMTPQRMYVLWQLARHAAALPGAADSAEIGVWRGGASHLLAELGRPRTHFVLDTFEGLPEADAHRLPRGAFGDTSAEAVTAYLAPLGNAVVLKGLFPDTAGPLEARRFSFVHLDMDLEAETRAGLEFFFPRLVPGGVIVVDDYGSRHVGVTRAVDGFLDGKAQRPLVLAPGQCVLLKGP